jgi:hypothetical protein
VRILGVTASSILKVTSSYESIASATGTGSSATITFSSIPSTYKHLQIRWIARSTFSSSSAINMKVYINSDTGANYAYHQLFGDGTSATATGSASQTEIIVAGACAGNSMTSGIMGTGILDIADYASTTKTKTLRSFAGIDTNTTTGSIRLSSGLYNSTTAMSSISFETNNGNFGTTSTFALYGIK